MLTLGINAAFHDSSAAAVVDGRLIAAAEEERFSRIKHGKRPVPFSAYELPFHAIDYCLREANATLADVDHFAYSYDPYLRLKRKSAGTALKLPLEPSSRPIDPEWESAWDPLFLSYIVNAPRHLVGGFPHHLSLRFRETKAIDPSRWHFVDHHLCHAASAFLVSPFEEAAILTIDGRGEKATTTYGLGRGSRIEQLGQVVMPHSLGILYEQVTSYLGFLHSSDEYKVMALASFGRPRFLGAFREAIRVGEEGGYSIDTSRLWPRLGPARAPGEPLQQRHHDIAHSMQVAMEDAVLEIARWLYRATGADDLCMAGGVALNCVLNSAIRDRGPFGRIWVQPAAGDAGTALGAALVVDLREGKGERASPMQNVYLGPEYSEIEIEACLAAAGLSASKPDDIADAAARLLEEDKVLGWFQGRMEFGPRALGSRSILASPRRADMQQRLNWIKEREDFRPLAPVVMEEEAHEWFRTGGAVSPFMLFVHDVPPEKAALIPAVCHVDNSARIQTVSRSQNPLYYDLLAAFRSATGIPVLVNTSFNTRTRPIVCTPTDALECFFTSPIDALAIGPFLLRKDGY